jgi:hypothetical protein
MELNLVQKSGSKVLEFGKIVIELKSKGSKIWKKLHSNPLPENLHINFKMFKPDQRFSQ